MSIHKGEGDDFTVSTESSGHLIREHPPQTCPGIMFNLVTLWPLKLRHKINHPKSSRKIYQVTGIFGCQQTGYSAIWGLKVYELVFWECLAPA